MLSRLRPLAAGVLVSSCFALALGCAREQPRNPGEPVLTRSGEYFVGVAVLPLVGAPPTSEVNDPQLMSTLEDAVRDYVGSQPLAWDTGTRHNRLLTGVLRIMGVNRLDATGTAPGPLRVAGVLASGDWFLWGPIPYSPWARNRNPVRIDLNGGPGSYSAAGPLKVDVDSTMSPEACVIRYPAFGRAEAKFVQAWSRRFDTSEAFEKTPSTLTVDPHGHRLAMRDSRALTAKAIQSLATLVTRQEPNTERGYYYYQFVASTSPDGRFEIRMFVDNSDNDNWWLRDKQRNRSLELGVNPSPERIVWLDDKLFLDAVTCSGPEGETFVHLEIDLERMRILKAVLVGQMLPDLAAK